MSHPVFLNNAPTGCMPDGSKNEWASFFGTERLELESNAAIPILWLALFRSSDIQTARLIDDEDLTSPDRDDLADCGDSEYCYLVTPISGALSALRERKEALLAGLGENYRPIVDGFETHLRRRYAPFVLLRTSGLPDVEDFGPALAKVMADMDEFCSGFPSPGNAISAEMASFRDWRHLDPIYLLCGKDWSAAWPSAELRACFPKPQRPTPSQRTKAKKPQSRMAKVLEWAITLLGGVALMGIYVRTGSLRLTLLGLIPLMVAFWLLS
jgi:hypothetical protein